MIEENLLSIEDVSQYEFLYDLLVSIEKNKRWIEKEDRFHYLMEDGCGEELPEMPVFKYDLAIPAPKESVIEMLYHISYMLKNEMRLPPAIILYLCHFIDSTIRNGGYELKETFTCSTNKEDVDENYAKDYYYIRNYINMRVSLLYTLGYSWDRITTLKNNKGADFYQEISDELEYKYKKGDFYENDENIKSLVSLKKENIKKIVNKTGVKYTLKFINFNVMPTYNHYDKELARQYRTYLEERARPERDSPPLGNKDAKERLKELGLVEEYLNLNKDELPADKSFKTWLSMKNP
ncbi:hypothetical protein [Providencia stuartii]|uniref:hypothetical protein n=1 Tax=Providencia stuartii TaxID=588 RepID=UPI00197F1138|nr:hypothetical protein [Providencia stuartii]MBN4863797.1 hypothetical protein [Providencia stuartii]MBN4873119.1 hypothetical protein [Providencia stuartii]MBN4877760.1 hypothetical protein [Providencia stuartii]MBN4882320.1 hypothetical protein [Providencia stuartii]